MAHGSTPITGNVNTIIGGVAPSVATGTQVQSSDVNDPLQAVCNDIATISTGACSFSGAKAFTGPVTFSYTGGAAVIVGAGGATIAGTLTCNGELLSEGNALFGSGHNLLTAATCQMGGSSGSPAGTTGYWAYFWCTSQTAAQFDGVVTCNNTVSCTLGLSVSGGPVNLAATIAATTAPSKGDLWQTNTCVCWGTIQIAAGVVTVVDGYNISAVDPPVIGAGRNVVANTALTITFALPLANQGSNSNDFAATYSVIPAATGIVPMPFTFATSKAELSIGFQNAGSSSDVVLTGVTLTIMFHVFGRQ